MSPKTHLYHKIDEGFVFRCRPSLELFETKAGNMLTLEEFEKDSNQCTLCARDIPGLKDIERNKERLEYQKVFVKRLNKLVSNLKIHSEDPLGVFDGHGKCIHFLVGCGPHTVILTRSTSDRGPSLNVTHSDPLGNLTRWGVEPKSEKLTEELLYLLEDGSNIQVYPLDHRDY